MSDRKPEAFTDVDTGHEYDGIREFDNKLPNWWLATLFLSIFFSIGYWLYYHTFEGGSDQLSRYEMELADAAAAAASRAQERGDVSDEALLAFSADAGKVGSGKDLFATYCLACHGPDGGGTIGPNLTDDHWLTGSGKPMEIRQIISAGVTAKGMPAWGQLLGDEKVDQITAFVLTLKGKNVPGKGPEGEIASAD